MSRQAGKNRAISASSSEAIRRALGAERGKRTGCPEEHPAAAYEQ